MLLLLLLLLGLGSGGVAIPANAQPGLQLPLLNLGTDEREARRAKQELDLVC